MVLVVLIHSEYLEARQFPVALWITRFTGARGLASVAVPMFFLFSGMLFFNCSESVSKVFSKMKRRCLTILLPYILWNIIFVLWYVVVQSIPALAPYNNSDVVGFIFGGSLGHGLYEVFVTPINFPLWFLKDLIIYVAFAPAIYYLLRWLKIWAILPIFILALVDEIYFNGLIFFALGGWIAMYSGLDKIESLRRLAFPSCMVFVGAAVAVGCGVYFWLGICDFVFLCGILAVWFGYDYLARRFHHAPRWILDASRYSFFIYCFHEPTFNVVKKIMLTIFGQSQPALITLYFVNVVLMCAICVLVAKALDLVCPKFYGLLTGFRK